jgi:hypothetical protein
MAIKKNEGYRYPRAGSGKPKDVANASRRQDRRFFADVAAILRAGRAVVCKAVNSAMVGTYWQIGRRIVEQEQRGKSRADYGEYLLVNLSRYLGETFGKGFSYSNLRNFRQFYLTFPDSEICYTLCSKLSWSHVRLIMRLDNERERRYYLDETRAQSWSVRELERNIRSGYYRRKYSVLKENRRLFASKYTMILPTEEELAAELHRNAPYLREAAETYYASVS